MTCASSRGSSEVTMRRPVWALTWLSVTPESAPTSSRTDISQCPQVIPDTWYSFVVAMIVLLSTCYPQVVSGGDDEATCLSAHLDAGHPGELAALLADGHLAMPAGHTGHLVLVRRRHDRAPLILIPPGGIGSRLRLYPLRVPRKLFGGERRASTCLHRSPHGFLGGARFRCGFDRRSDVPQLRGGDECGESGDDSGNQAGDVQPAGERLLRCGGKGRADSVG